MFLSADSASQHSSMFSSICFLSIDQLSRASVCLTSATSCNSSGNYLTALQSLLIFMSTCRNICFSVSFVNTTSYRVSLHILSTSHLAHRWTWGLAVEISHKEVFLLDACYMSVCSVLMTNSEFVTHNYSKYGNCIGKLIFI